MSFVDTSESLSENRNPMMLLLIIMVLAFAGSQFIGAFFGLIFAMPFYSFDLAQIYEAFEDPVNHPGIKISMYIVQGVASLVGFIVIPWLYIRFYLKQNIRIFRGERATALLPAFLTFIVVITFMVFNSFFIEWNMNVDLPGFLDGFENWARAMEDKMMAITEFLTDFSGINEMLIALVVIAVIPAIGEELVFRGFVQSHLYQIFKNPHIAIWSSAFLFAAFHMQFYGLVPRMFLGALFGYMYYWSGNITYSMIAHFVNNGFTVTMMYLYKSGGTDFNIEETESVQLLNVVIFGAITAGILFLFHRFFRTANE